MRMEIKFSSKFLLFKVALDMIYTSLLLHSVSGHTSSYVIIFGCLNDLIYAHCSSLPS